MGGDWPFKTDLTPRVLLESPWLYGVALWSRKRVGSSSALAEQWIGIAKQWDLLAEASDADGRLTIAG
jgi:hypothetical protein